MFSIIMPLYNKAEDVAASINSVLQQSVSAFELIIINDGSTDNSLSVAQAHSADPRIRIIDQENAGVSVARNRGISKARFDYLAFLDADDLWDENFLAHIQGLITQFPDAGIYATAYAMRDGEQQQPARIHGLAQQPQLVWDYFAVASRGDLPLMPSSVCIPNWVLRQVGGFPEDQRQGEDQDLWARICLQFPYAITPAIGMYYCLSGSNRVSVNSIPKQELGYSQRLQAMLDQGEIPRCFRHSVRRYIGGHLLHLAQLNVRAGQIHVARAFLGDPRTWRLPLRWLKWFVQSFLMPAPAPEKPRVVHLLNDINMGGIRSVVDSLSTSELAEQFEFSFTQVDPCCPLSQRYEAEIIMVHYAMSWRHLPGLLMLRLRNRRARLLIQEHHYSAAFAQAVSSQPRFYRMLRLSYRLADKVIAVSQGQGDWLRQQKLLPAAKLQTIPQSRRLDEFLSVPAKTIGQPLILGAYGRFHPQKGFDTLLAAVARLPAEQFQLFIGGSGEQESLLLEQAKAYPHILMCGVINKVPQFLQSCDLVVVPSRYEPFGLVCLEAKAAGRPVLVSDVDGLPEQAQGCGLIVPSDDVQALYQALLSLPQQPLARWGTQARAQVANDWTRYIQQWRTLFTQELAQ